MIIERRRKKQELSCRLLLVVLLYELVTALIFLFLPVTNLIQYFSPLAFLYSYLVQFFDPKWIILAFAVLPLICWLLCRMNHYTGKVILIVLQVLLLFANAFITTSHFILGLGVKSSDYLWYTFFSALCPLVFCILIIVLVNIWKPTYEK